MSKNNWKNMINSKSRDYDFDTISGEKLESLYYPNEDSNNFINEINYPGEFPYTRGIHPNMYRGKIMDYETIFWFWISRRYK